MEKEINVNAWNKWAKDNQYSDWYIQRIQAVVNTGSSLFSQEKKFFNSVEGKSVMHLQCHSGIDSISLHKSGFEVTAVDFSEQSIHQAEEFNNRFSTQVRFIQSDIFELDDSHLNQYDIAFASYGVLIWIADLDKWFEVVNGLLKPGGQLYLIDFHPVLNFLDGKGTTMTQSYFNSNIPLSKSRKGTYADGSKEGETIEFFNWHHTVSHIINATIKSGLELLEFNEYNHSVYKHRFDNMIQLDEERWQIKDCKVPMLFSIQCRKK